MPGLRQFLAGLLAGLLFAGVALALTARFLPHLLVVDDPPAAVDAIVVLGGDSDGSRLRTGLRLLDDKFAPQLVLVANSGREGWERILKAFCPDCSFAGRPAMFLTGSTDTRTDAQLTLEHCRSAGLRSILVVTSPYHTRRTALVFADIFAGSGIVPQVVSSGSYGRLLPPDGRWWSDRRTVETVWLEFGKVLFWELTPFLEFQGDGARLKEGERGR
ncbi:MAG: YdcF family protein [Deltaproteobacteria bacterium]|nr:MAG: YdcF family protein [Deltaproteobacteria bacterium]